MPEEILFASEHAQSREEIAAYLRSVASSLEAGGEITLSEGEQSLTLAVPPRPEFEVKAERETNGGGAEIGLEFELEWPEDAGSGDGSLSIE